MNKFSASEIHILGHMFLSRRKSRGEADGCKFCQKGFREAVLRTVIPWCKLTSISPCQRFCDTASALPAGLRDQLLSPAHLGTSPVCSIRDLSSWMRAGGNPVWATLLKHAARNLQDHLATDTATETSSRQICLWNISSFIYRNQGSFSKAWDICLISVFLRLGRSQHGKMKQMNKTKVMYWFLHSLPVTRFHSFACWINAEI